jgi:hypothetical protein
MGCFNFLLSRNADMGRFDELETLLVNFAVFGGNAKTIARLRKRGIKPPLSPGS